MQQRKKGFFIKYIIAIGSHKNSTNGEHLSGFFSYIDKHPVILNEHRFDYTRVDRIVEQIKMLAEYAKDHHNIERLTCLITDEFSFYTRSTPLSLDEYREIINKISFALKNFPPNIVLIISSLPVLWSDKTMRNAVLRILTPNTPESFPIIYHFSKENISPTDPYYSRISPVSLQLDKEDCYEIRPDDYSSEHSPDIVLQKTGAECYSKNQYKSAIVIRGLHLPPIILTIDICLDHTKQVAMYNAKELLERIDNEIPVYIAHVNSANTLPPYEKALCASPVQADRLTKQVGNVTEKKNETKRAHFGRITRFFVYHQMRAEILTDRLVIAAHKISNSNIAIHSLIDQYKNTILHQIFLTNKTSIGSHHQYRQLKNFPRVIPYFEGNMINQQNEDGETPLHLALKITNDELILVKLLEHGARLDIKNKKGQSPIEWAYDNNKIKLINLLLNKVIDNKNIYLNHHDNILSLLNDINDEELKRKVAASALCLEISFITPEKIDEKKAIELLMIADKNSVRMFIQPNISQLLTTYKKEMLYFYLIDHHVLDDDRNQMISLPALVKARLIELELLKESACKKDISLYEKGITRLLYHFTESDCNLINNIICNKIKYYPCQLSINIINHIIQSYLLKNNKLVKTILSYLPSIQDEKIKTNIVANCILQFLYVDIINKKIHTTPIKTLSWKTLAKIDLFADKNEIILLEKKLIHAFKSQDAILLDSIVSRSSHMINFMMIEKISSTQGVEKIAAQKWFYQQLLENELSRSSNINITMLFFTLYFNVFIDFNKLIYPSITTIELFIFKICLLQNAQLLNNIIQLMPKSFDIAVLINKVEQLLSPHFSIIDWLYQTLLNNELARDIFANNQILLFVLSKINNCDTKRNAKSLTHGEELITIACLQDNTKLLDQIRIKFPQLFNQDTIAKIAHAFENENRTEQWIYQELIKNEFKRNAKADISLIWNAMPFCELTASSGIKSLTIGEQLIAQAFTSNSSFLLNCIKKDYPDLFHPFTLNKITQTLPNKHQADKWIYHELIKNEFKRGYHADLNIIFTALQHAPLNLLNSESGMNLFNIDEQLLFHAYRLKNPDVLFYLLTSIPNFNFDHVCVKLAKSSLFPQEGFAWLRQQVVNVIEQIQTILANQTTQTRHAASLFTLFSKQARDTTFKRNQLSLDQLPNLSKK